MSSLGETLRRERLRKGLSLEQISHETKISARLLDAIEKDQLNRLPGGVFAKSFVRQYARYLGLDEDEFAAEVERTAVRGADLPSFAAPPEPVFKVPRVFEWEGGGRAHSSVLPSLAWVVAVMLVCSAVYAWWQKSRAAAPTRRPIAAVKKAPPAITPAVASNGAAAPRTDVLQPLPMAEAAAALPENPNPAATLHVSLTAASDVWVHVWTDNKSVMEGTVKPDGGKTFDAVDSIRIRAGNAGGLQMTVNGKPAGQIGPVGQIRIVEVTNKGVQILPPPPKPAPAAPAPEPL